MKSAIEASDTESLTYEFELDAPLEKVWHALTTPELVAQWLLPLASEPAAEVELELESCRPPTYVAYHWHGEDEPQTLVIFELRTAEGGGTRLRLTHRLPAYASGPVALLKAA